MGITWSVLTDFFVHPAPATIVLLVGQIALFFYHSYYNVDPASFAFRYDAVVHQYEYWRCLTAVFSHLGILHIVFNMFTLFSLAFVEHYVGTPTYLRYTFLLIFGETLGMLAFGALFERCRPSWLAQLNHAGFSGVLFGWLTFVAFQDPTGTMTFIFINVPALAYPFIYLVVLQIAMLNRVSFFGHLCGIIAGALLWSGVFDWFTNSLFLTTFVWSVIALVYNVKFYSPWELAWIKVADEGAQPGRRRRIINGRIFYDDS